MTPGEIGLLVMKMQADEVLASDMRRFIKALMSDEEIRRNARLAAPLSGLPDEVKKSHCLSNVLMLLSAAQLAPDAAPPDGGWCTASDLFLRKFYISLSGPWRAHIHSTLSITEVTQAVMRSKSKSSSPLPTILLSPVLAGHVRTIEEFWGVNRFLLL